MRTLHEELTRIDAILGVIDQPLDGQAIMPLVVQVG